MNPAVSLTARGGAEVEHTSLRTQSLVDRSPNLKRTSSSILHLKCGDTIGGIFNHVDSACPN